MIPGRIRSLAAVTRLIHLCYGVVAMSPEQAIASLDELLKQVHRIRSHMSDEAESIAMQWNGLGRVGGQRADHAAQLLSRLRPHFDEMAEFCAAVSQQLTGFIADPFQRDAA